MHIPRRTARLRLTLLYGAAVLGCGVIAVALIYAYLFYGNTANLGSSSPQPTTSVDSGQPTGSTSAQSTVQGPTVEMKIPATAVTGDGRYDAINVPVTTIKQLNQSLFTRSASQRTALISAAEIRVNYDKRQLLIACAIGLAVIAVTAAGVGWLIAGRVLRPLSTITSAARRISASSLGERLALHGPDDELKELADTLDSLFERLEASFDAQRHFAASASHELRTPLTRERTLLQVTRADPAATIGTWQTVSGELLASNAEQERLIEALLTLASSEATSGQHEPLDLADITSEALAVPRPGISRLSLDVKTDVQPAILDGDPLLVQQLVTNLIDNAVQHNVPDGNVQVVTGARDGHAVLSVTSSGPVIPDAEVDRLFQPFQRLGTRHVRRDGGHGLGLSIVRAIAAAHGATIAAQPRPGGGLAIDVTFPPP